MIQGLGALFALMALAIAVAGLAASGQLVVQGFTRTAVSLLSLALYLLPLVGLSSGPTPSVWRTAVPSSFSRSRSGDGPSSLGAAADSPSYWVWSPPSASVSRAQWSWAPPGRMD